MFNCSNVCQYICSIIASPRCVATFVCVYKFTRCLLDTYTLFTLPTSNLESERDIWILNITHSKLKYKNRDCRRYSVHYPRESEKCEILNYQEILFFLNNLITHNQLMRSILFILCNKNEKKYDNFCWIFLSKRALQSGVQSISFIVNSGVVNFSTILHTLIPLRFELPLQRGDEDFRNPDEWR